MTPASSPEEAEKQQANKNSEDARPSGDAEAAETDESKSESSEKSAAAPEIKQHIVLVDDDAAFADAARAFFQEKNISVQTYTSRAQLEEKPFDHPPTLLAIDVDAGGEDGRSLALDLRDAGKLGDAVLVLLINSPMDKATIDFTLKLGFRKVLRKPISCDVLERILLDEPRRKAAGLKASSGLTSQNLQKVDVPDDEAEDNDQPHILPVKQASSFAASKTSAIAQAMNTAMSMPPVKGSSPAPAKAVDKFAPPAQAYTPSQKPATRVRTEEKSTEPSSGSMTKGIVFGAIYAIVAAIILGFTVSAGYVHSFMIGEGVLIGIAAGIGLIQGWKKSELNPAMITFGALIASFSGWAALLAIRAWTDAPFVERTAAMIQFSKEHPDHVREWGTSESTALGFIIGQLIVAFIVTMFLSRFRSTNKRTL